MRIIQCEDCAVKHSCEGDLPVQVITSGKANLQDVESQQRLQDPASGMTTCVLQLPDDFMQVTTCSLKA